MVYCIEVSQKSRNDHFLPVHLLPQNARII